MLSLRHHSMITAYFCAASGFSLTTFNKQPPARAEHSIAALVSAAPTSQEATKRPLSCSYSLVLTLWRSFQFGVSDLSPSQFAFPDAIFRPAGRAFIPFKLSEITRSTLRWMVEMLSSSRSNISSFGIDVDFMKSVKQLILNLFNVNFSVFLVQFY